MEDIRESLISLQNSIVTTFERPLVTHRKGFFGKIDLLLKRVVRKCTRFLFKPYTEGMYKFQNHTLNTLHLIACQFAKDEQLDLPPSLPIAVPNVPLASNGKVDVSEVSVVGKKFLFVTWTDILLQDGVSRCPISEDAKRGVLHIDTQLLGLFKKPGTFLDIGANVGVVSMSLAAHGWKGYAFEASSSNAALLRKSAVLNGFDVEVIETAVYNKTGKLYFSQLGPWGIVQTDMMAHRDFAEIECIDLDNWAQAQENLHSIEFIKMDIEGSEVAAFEGMYQMLEKYGYPPIFIEVNMCTLIAYDLTPKSVFQHARSFGYNAYRMRACVLYEVNYDDFLEDISEDFVLIKGEFDNIAYPVARYKSSKACETIARLVEILKRVSASQAKWIDELGYVYTLKDYPEYYENHEIKSLLKQIYVGFNEDNTYSKKATDWIEGIDNE